MSRYQVSAECSLCCLNTEIDMLIKLGLSSKSAGLGLYTIECLTSQSRGTGRTIQSKTIEILLVSCFSKYFVTSEIDALIILLRELQ